MLACARCRRPTARQRLRESRTVAELHSIPGRACLALGDQRRRTVVARITGSVPLTLLSAGFRSPASVAVAVSRYDPGAVWLPVRQVKRTVFDRPGSTVTCTRNVPAAGFDGFEVRLTGTVSRALPRLVTVT